MRPSKIAILALGVAMLGVWLAYDNQRRSTKLAVDQLVEQANDLIAEKQVLLVPVAPSANLTARLTAAYTKLERALRLDPNHSEAHNLLGVYYVYNRNWRSARQQFETAMRLNPRAYEPHVNLATAYVMSGLYSDALRECDHAESLRPGSLVTALIASTALSEMNQQVDTPNLAEVRLAQTKLEIIVRAEPANYVALMNLGNAFLIQRRPTEAISAYRRALDLGAKQPQIFCNLAMVLLQVGAVQDAKRAAIQAITLVPNYANAFNALAMVQLQLGDGIAAAAAQLEAQRLDAPNRRYERQIAIMDQSRPEDMAIVRAHVLQKGTVRELALR